MQTQINLTGRAIFNFLKACSLATPFLILALRAEANPRLRNGDFIFQTSLSHQANAIMLATASRWSHVGLIEVTPQGEVFVIEAIAKVSRTPLAKWIQRGKNGAYKVLRHPQMGALGQQAVRAAKGYLGRPYDIYFSSRNREIYCSELVDLALRQVGLKVGRTQKIRELRLNSGAVQKLVQARWKAHPACQKLRSFEACWSTLLNEDIITPASQAEDRGMIEVQI